MKIKYCVVLLVAGCGGSETSTNSFSRTTTPAPTSIAANGDLTIVSRDESYERLGEETGNTLTLGGSAVEARASGTDNEIFDVVGTLVNEDGGAVTLTDYAGFASNDGFIASGSGSSRTFAATQTQDNAVVELLTTGRSYDYMSPYSHERNVAGTDKFAIGVLGVTTNEADMPMTGTASYSGESVAFFSSGTGTIASNGTSRINADFEDNTVSVTSNFRVWEDENGLTATTPFTEIQHNDMAITGNSYQGGSHVVRNGFSEVTPTGANSKTIARGTFFGGVIVTKNDVETKRPAETGGVASIKGDDGAIINTFFGD